ncbi:aldo/keto reductase [Pelagibacterales bacterium SAG-MED13]|nr:aldo/keto reductase [Pelagibacterales bacterium SAG-MED13]
MEIHTLFKTQYTKIGWAKIKVSKISLGTWGLGGSTINNLSYGFYSKEKAKKTILEAFENGINFFDTSLTYGNAEKIVGETIQKIRSNVIIASKLGVSKNYSRIPFDRKTADKQVSSILKSIKSDYIDILQLYNPKVNSEDCIRYINYLKKLKKKGVIREYGLTLGSPNEILNLNKNYMTSVIQCNFNLLDLRILNPKILKIIKKNNISILARTILNFGIFTENFLLKKNQIFKKKDHRNGLAKQQLVLWRKALLEIKKICNEDIENTAIKFVNSYKFVSSLIIGIQNKSEFKKNLNILNQKALKKDQIKNILLINKKNYFYKNLKPNNLLDN